MKTAQEHGERAGVRNTDPDRYQRQIEDGVQGKTLAQQAVFAHRLGDQGLLEAILRHSFSSTAQHREEDPPSILRSEHFPDRSVFEFVIMDRQTGPETGWESGWDFGVQPRTADQTFSLPGICDRPCCRTIRHLRDPEAAVPWMDGRTKPRPAPPTDRQMYTQTG